MKGAKMAIRVLVNGAKGKTGRIAIQAVKNDHALKLVGKADHEDHLPALIGNTRAQVVIDLTSAEVVYENSLIIIDSGAHPLIGTSGLLPDEVRILQEKCREKGLGGMIVPNFSISAILMMKFAKEAARFFPSAEIIDLHHDEKLDSPSATAIHTAEMISENLKPKAVINVEKNIIPGARGAGCKGIPIHSIRLPGLVSHHRVVFGGSGETFILESNTLSREAFMAGICLACKKVVGLNRMYCGLENII
jgi:4-hydroxy-tetrahydrodipicolinate reductase